MEELSEALIDLVQFLLDMTALVVVLFVVFLGVKIVNKIRDEL